MLNFLKFVSHSELTFTSLEHKCNRAKLSKPESNKIWQVYYLKRQVTLGFVQHKFISFIGKDWKYIQEQVKTRTSVQARSHAQKILMKAGNNKLNSYNNIEAQNKTIDDLLREHLEKLKHSNTIKNLDQSKKSYGYR